MMTTTLVMLIAMVIPPAQTDARQREEWAAQVRSAAAMLESRSGESHRAVAALAGTLRQIAEKESSLPESFKTRMRTAADSLNRQPLGEEGRLALHEAYRALTGGTAFEFPTDVKSIEDASRLAKQKIERSLQALATGRVGPAAREIAEYLLLVITPMMADGR